MTATTTDPQQIVDASIAAGVAHQTLAVAWVMRYAADPLTALTWLASVEEDDDLRFAYQTAAELLRARRETDTS